MRDGQTYKKQTKKIRLRNVHIPLFIALPIIIVSFVIIGLVLFLSFYDYIYSQKIYPHVYINNVDVGNKYALEVKDQWEKKNTAYTKALFELRVGNQIATISGEQLGMGYDSNLIEKQAYSVGRSGNFISDIYTRLFKQKTDIQPYFRWDQEQLNSTLTTIAESVEVPAEDARFSFTNGKVQEFKPAKTGKKLNTELAVEQLKEVIPQIPESTQTIFPINLEVEDTQPEVTTDKSNTYGIKQKIGSGYSEFQGSITGRIHNIALASSKFNGVLIPPNSVISYNQIVGDISASTGFQQAYIIKDGRTVLGDGGGVCQVSTTLFRAAMDAGLPIIERTAHAYRVHYYEEGGFKPGLDATVFSPTVDLKIKNDTPAYILIQTSVDTKKMTLNINLYGTSDGRTAEIINHQILSQTPPPAPLYEDDPTLAPGEVKQIDWAAWGANVVFTYRVKRDGKILTDKQFHSNFRPWQAVYLRGPQI